MRDFLKKGGFVFLLLSLVIGVGVPSFAYDGNFYSSPIKDSISSTVFDSNGTTPLPVGCALEFINAGADGVANELKADGTPGGDDTLVVTGAVGDGGFGAGTFYIYLSGVADGAKVYVRAWNVATAGSLPPAKFGNSIVYTLPTPPSPPADVNVDNFRTDLQLGGGGGTDNTKPTIKDLKSGGIIIQDGDVISPHAILTATITDEAGSGVDVTSIKVTIKGTDYKSSTSPAVSYEASSANGQMTLGFTQATLPDGSYAITINANDMAGNAATPYIVNVVVQAGEAVIDGKVFNFPNPFNPIRQPTTIAYNLTNDANIALYVFDITAKLVWEAQYDSGASGGKLGYNEVPWTGYSGFNDLPGSGVYLVRVVNRDTRRVIGKGKIVIALR